MTTDPAGMLRMNFEVNTDSSSIIRILTVALGYMSLAYVAVHLSTLVS